MGYAHKKVFAFLDTNIFLHFQDIESIDWCTALDAEFVCLVITLPVIRELDKHKYDRDSRRMQNRSRSALKLIESLFSETSEVVLANDEHVTVRVVLLTSDPIPTDYDDWIIASIINFSSELIENAITILISDDTGISIRAKLKGILSHHLDDQYRLKSEPTTEEQKVQRLEKRIQEFERREPNLTLTFDRTSDQENPSMFELEITKKIIDEKGIQELITQEIQETEWKRPTPPRTPNPADPTKKQSMQELLADLNDWNHTLAFQFSRAVTQDEIDRYVEEREIYLQEYKDWIIRRSRINKILDELAKIEIFIENKGSSVANGVIVKLYIPDGLQVFDIYHLPKLPIHPERPEKPRYTIGMLSLGTGSRSADLLIPPFSSQLQSDYLPDPDTLGPDIEKSQITSLTWKRTKIYHQIPLRLTPIGLVFPDQAGEFHYELRYELFAENMTSAVQGCLYVKTNVIIPN